MVSHRAAITKIKKERVVGFRADHYSLCNIKVHDELFCAIDEFVQPVIAVVQAQISKRLVHCQFFSSLFLLHELMNFLTTDDAPPALGNATVVSKNSPPAPSHGLQGIPKSRFLFALL